MADSKRKSSAKQVIDIHKPGKTMADDTSKPVIINNRQIIRDPMVTADNVDTEIEKTAPTEVKTTVQPLTAPILPKGMEISYGPRGSQEDTEPEVEVKDEVEAEDSPVVPDEPEQPILGSDDPDETPAEDPKETSDAPAIKLHLKAIDPEKVDVSPAAETEDPTDPEPEVEPEEKEDTPPLTKRKTIEPSAELTAQVREEKDAPDPEVSEEELKTPEIPAEVDKAKAEAEAKHEAELQQLIESKKYFLPVNSLEKRRAERFVMFGIVLAVILALAWVNIALDAGIIKIDGVQPLTHFFSN